MIFNTLPEYNGPFKVSCLDVELKTPKASIMKLYYPTNKNTREYTNFFPYPTEKYFKGFTNYARMNDYLATGLSYFLSNSAKLAALRGNGRDLLLPVPNPTQKFPVMIFSHGLAGNRTMYSTFCGDMASYGIVVCAIEHRDHSGSYSWTQNEPQDVAYIRQPQDKTEKEFRSEQIKVRVDEIDQAWKFLKELGDGKFENEVVFNEKSADYIPNPSLEPFKNRLDLENPILTGHSFGGATVLEYSSKKEHPFKCTVVMDPWMTPIDAKPISTPVLSINTEGFTNWKENWEPTDKHMRSIQKVNPNAHLATIHKIVHYHQSDGPNLLLSALKLYYRKLEIEPKRATQLNNGLAISFIAETFKSLNLDSFKDEKLKIPSWDLLRFEKLWNEEFYFHK